MRAIKFLTATLIAAVALTSCNDNDGITGSEKQAVRFTAGIDQAVISAPVSRAAGTAWANGDAIGIFMVGNGNTTIAESAENRQYTTTTGNSAFTAAPGNDIYYPMDGSAVDFIAYYPFKTGTTLSSFIDVAIGTTQTTASQPGFDLLWAKANNTAAGYTKSYTGGVALAFDHQLSKLVLNCKPDASVGAITGMSVSIKGMNTKNKFNLATGTLGASDTQAAITPRTLTSAPAGFDMSYDAIVLPGSYDDGTVTVEFTVGTEVFTWNVGAVSFNSGKEYTYEVTLTRTGVTITATINPWTTESARQGTAE